MTRLKKPDVRTGLIVAWNIVWINNRLAVDKPLVHPSEQTIYAARTAQSDDAIV
jgi:hypothetical protein